MLNARHAPDPPSVPRRAPQDRRDLLIRDEQRPGWTPRPERAIHREPTAHRAGRTKVLISHRLGSVRHADRIADLVDGRVSELDKDGREWRTGFPVHRVDGPPCIFGR